jgi:hypothetical protein
MAASKSASRKSAAKRAGKTRKSRPAAKKASKTRKPRGAAKKAAVTRKKRPAAKKAVVTRKAKVPASARAKTTANTTTLMSEGSPAIVEIDNRIAIVRNNLRDLVAQATSYSGAAAEELTSQRIAEQEAKLELLRKQREELSGERS